MGKFLLGVLIGAILTIAVGFVVVLAIGRLFSPKQPTVPANAALVLKLDGVIPEAAPVDFGVPFFPQQSGPTIRDVWTSLRNAATDNRIKGVVFQPHNLQVGWGRLEEIRQELQVFKKSGKPVYAYLQSPGSHEFYVATVADKIFMSPDDFVDVKGFALEELYFKNTLEKTGIGVQVDHIGRYKDAGDIFTKTSMSPETRDVLNQVLDQIYGDFCQTSGQGRHKTAEEMKAIVDMGPYTAPQAKDAGLVDELGYEDEVYGDLKRKAGVELNKIGISTYFHASPGRGDRIALLVGEGEITHGGNENSMETGEIASAAFSKAVRQVRNDATVKGVILRVDSPGGDSVASDEILHELKLLAKAKPVVISMSDVAASGGYFISMTGDPLLAYPNTITGSIGVLYVRPNIRGLYDKLGISQDQVSRGKLADLDSLSTPLSDAAKQKLHESIEATYRSFVSKVAGARKKSYDQIDALAQGRVWMGAQAQQNGLVDQTGGLDQAIALIRKRAKLPENGDTNLVMYPPRRSLIEILTSSSADATVEAAMKHRIDEIAPGLARPALLRGGLLKILPWQLSVQ